MTDNASDTFGKDFWWPLAGGIIMLALTLLAVHTVWDTKAAIGADLALAFFGAALSRFRKVRLVRRLRSFPELERIYRKRAK